VSAPGGGAPTPGGRRAGWRRPVWNVLTNWAAFLVNVAIGLVLSPYVVHRLGGVEYGVWVLLSSLVGYLGLLDLGARSAVTKYVATLHAERRHGDASLLVSTALVLFGGLALVAVGASALLALAVAHLFTIPAPLVETARRALVLSGLNVAVSLVTGVFAGTVVARQRFGALNAVTIAVGVVRAVAIVLTLQAGGRLVGLAAVHLGVSLAQGATTAWLGRRVYPELAVAPRSWTPGHLVRICRFGMASWLLHATGFLVNYADALVIGSFLPVGAITPFAIAANLTDQVRAVIAGVSQPVTPMAGALDGERAESRIPGLLLDGARFATLAIAPIVVTLEIRGTSFIAQWMGAAYARDAGAVLAVLGPAVWAFAGFQVLTAAMIGLDRHRGLVPIFAGEALANLLLSVAWVGPYGIVGVAWGTALPRLLVSLLVGPLYARRHAGVPVLRYWEWAVVRPAGAILPFAAATLALETWWPASTLVALGGQILLALPAAAAGAWLLGLTPAERRLLARMLAVPRIAWGGAS
jgi:O-antigen/teichoic acid export membrane protein